MNPKIILFLPRLVKEILLSAMSLGMVRLSTITALIIGLIAGSIYYSHKSGVDPTRPAPRPVPQTLEAAISEVCQEVPTQLPRPDRALRPTLLLPLAGDRESLVTDHLRSALDLQGWYRPVEASLLEKTVDTIREMTGTNADTSSRSMQWTAAELARMMQSAKAETVLRGSVDRLSMPVEGPVEIQLRLELWELTPSQPVAVLKSFLNIERPEPGPPATEAKASRGGGFRFYCLAFFMALVWPLAMVPWMQRVLRKDSNEANLKALLGMTALPLVLFLLGLLWRGNGFFGILFQGTIAALFLFFYTAFILNMIQEKIR